MKKKAIKKKYAIFGALVIIASIAIIYQSVQPREPFSIPGMNIPDIESCEQFMQTHNVYERADCYTEAAVASLDPAICVKVGIGTWRESDCIKAVIAAAPEDPAVYEKLRNPYLRGMFQYQKLNLSSEEFNPDYGIEIYFLDIVKNETNILINTSAKHMFICEEIDNVYPRSQCYMAIASATNNTSICEKVQIDPYRDGCYWNIVNKILDPTICGKIVDIDMRTGCYSFVASMTKDASICEKIEIPIRKDACLKDAAEIKTGAKG